MSSPRNLFEKIWESHVVLHESEDAPGVLYVDLHLLHEVTSPQAFSLLRDRGLRVRRPDRCLATVDHSSPTTPRAPDGTWPGLRPDTRAQIAALEENCARHGIELFAPGDERRGIVHVVGPEQGATHPGMTVVCGDSHTSTHGAFGALAFGIGTTEVAHVLATQCLLQRKPPTLSVRVDGAMPLGTTAKDLALAIIAALDVDGGAGHVIEYRGSTVASLSMEQRMTLCNMSIEAGARAGMIAPDDVTFAWLEGRPRSPRGADWEEALDRWRRLPGDPGARFDREVRLDASGLSPRITWGVHPGQSIPIDRRVPDGEQEAPVLDYMGLRAGQEILGHPIQVVFVGSCTNGRLSDLRQAAAVLRGRKVADGVRMLVVPGSEQVKAEAEALGLHEVFREAGAEWREPGCSMCIAMNGDVVPPDQYAVSTSNRNFRGRQGPGARTFLASPATAAAAALEGAIADPRRYLQEVAHA